MRYRLYCAPQWTSESQYREMKPRLPPMSYTELDDALGMARLIRDRVGGGITTWEIECPDGSTIGRYEIARLLRERGDELVGRSKVY
ncbi:hypothetical protein SAMN05444161_9227 [Rhizobiales bacterium GAS191]|nr:hypothetical protein SAMN05444161_9227 [Rhizobiales bacterium GAS191]